MNILEEDKIAMNDWFLLQSKSVQENSKIIRAKDIGQDYMLHIDKKAPQQFIAQMPRRAGKTEDNTTPRITVSPNLIGCLVGYASSDEDFKEGTDPESVKQSGYRGGYEISELPFTHCLQPNSKLVYDADRSLEHWLVNYMPKYSVYKPIVIGKMFIKSVMLKAKSGSDPQSQFEIYIEHNKPEGIKLSPNNIIAAGYWKAVVVFDTNSFMRDCTKEKDFEVFKISKAEYETSKNYCAALLSYDAPKFTRW